MRAGAETYERLTSARRALALIEAQLVTGEWTDPIGRKIRLSSYAERWIAHHAGLRPRTRELYAWLLSAHILPYLGAMRLASITPDTVREWRATLLGAGVSQTATAKAYRLLRAVLMTATEDRIIPRNPCRIRGGGDEKPPERPVLTIAQVLDLADRMAARRFRVPILLATFASLRWGEAIALRRCDLDLEARTVSIRRQYVETNGFLMIAPPKSRAGIRTLASGNARARAAGAPRHLRRARQHRARVHRPARRRAQTRQLPQGFRLVRRRSRHRDAGAAFS
jgi:integrase